MAERSDQPSDFGRAVRSHRLAARLTQEELAARSGMSARSIGDIERGRVNRPRRDSARLIADALELAADDREQFLALARAACWTDRIGAPPAPAPARAGPSRAVPRQLPPDLVGFVGRGVQLKELDELVEAPSGLPVVVLSGTAGIGKTAVAVRWAHRAADRFPDGQLYANLRGFDTYGPSAPADVVHDFLLALGVPSDRVPRSLDARTALYRSLLADRRLLVLLDNAADAEQVRPLLPGGRRCPVLVTSRDPLAGLVAGAGARPVELELLAPAESRDLLRSRLGAERVETEPAAVDGIVVRCGGLPLALAITAARALSRPRLPLAATAADLARARDRLDPLRTGDAGTDVRVAFHWSYRLLGDPAARLFRLVGTAPGPEVSEAAAASLAGEPVDRTRSLLAELTQAHLVSQPTPDRYGCHDLLRSYAAELASTVDTATDRRAALHRLLDHLVHTARGAQRRLNPHRRQIDLPAPRPGVVVVDPGDHDGALAWFAAERAGLLAGLDRAAAAGFDLHAAVLPSLLSTYLDRRGQWDTWAAAQTVAIGAAERLGDRRQLGCCHRERGRALVRLGRHDDAEADLTRAVDLITDVGDDALLADAYLDLGWLENLRGATDLRPLLEKAFLLYRRSGNRMGEARTLSNLGWVDHQHGEHELARERLTEALALHREIGNSPGEANAEANLGHVHRAAGRHREALACAERALDLYAATADRYYQADTLVQIGDIHLALGAATCSRRAWEAALVLLDELGHPDAGGVRDRLARLPAPAPH